MIPLTVRSHYSLMWGTCAPRQICVAARRQGYRRLALTDTDNLYGLWPFLRSCEEQGLQPIIGAEVTETRSPQRVVCLVENEIGYRNLCRLITRRHQDGAFGLDIALPDHAQGLIVLTQSPALLADLHTAGVSVVGALPRRPGRGAVKLRQIARYRDVPVVATPGSFFLEPADMMIHRILRAIDLNTSLSRLPRSELAPAEAWLASAADYHQRFAAWPDAVQATHVLAERLAFAGPNFGLVLPPWGGSSERSAEEQLRIMAYQGARRRYGRDLSESVVERLEYELRIIAQMGFASYFLVVRDIVSRSPRICGRGSGAASLVAYCLAITNVCPIKHNLYFTRFLNPGRTDPPDIDVDFAWDERDDVLNAVLKHYEGHAAMVCNHVAFQPRMAIREVAKVFGLSDREIGQVSKRLPWFWRATFAADDRLLEHLRALPELKQLDFPEPWPAIITIAQRLIGIPRYLSVHSGGVVITPERLENYVPIEQAPKGVPIIQWEKDATEDAGLVKIDLLGNRSLGVIRDAIANIKMNGQDFDEQRWEPEDDPVTQANVARGHTMGCFYIESPATRLLQQKAGVGDFAHLVIHSSIIRPAANEFIREYVRRLRGGRWEPIHPRLADVLDETYGIMVYQEDVSKAAEAVAGFSPVEADGLRKIMSKKDKARRLKDYKERFVAGARKRGVEDTQIDAIWDMMMSFEGYSFCKPHSASYARVSFQAAYLKTHYPAEFMAAVISNQGGFYHAFAYVSEARRLGIKILPPHVNHSDIRWKGHDRTLRVGWLSVKHLSAGVQQRIVQQRRVGAYPSLIDFLKRVQPDENEVRALIHAGAFDALPPQNSRAALLWQLVYWQKTRVHYSAAPTLFHQTPDLEAPQFPPQNETERLRQEFAVLGFLCDRHPMVFYADRLKALGTVKACDLGRFVGQHIRAAGVLITGKVVHTKHGDPMEFLTFEDETGLIETTFFPKAYRRFCAMLDRSRPFILYGRVDEDFGALTLTVDRVERVPKMQQTQSCLSEENPNQRWKAVSSNPADSRISRQRYL